MARVELIEIAFRIFCDCGREFRAEVRELEDFKPECPYCDRRYYIRIMGGPEELRVEINPS